MKLNISNLLQIEHNCRNAESYSELKYIIVNEIKSLIPNKQAIFLAPSLKNKLEIENISDITSVDTSSVYVQTIEKISNKIYSSNSNNLRVVDFEGEFDSYEKNTLKENSYTNIIWMPIKIEKDDASLEFYMLLLNDEPWEKKHLEVCAHLSTSFAYFLYALRKNSFKTKLQSIGFGRGYFKYILLSLVLIMFIPVKLTVLAPLEVIAKDPFIVTSSLDGAVEQIKVKPNQNVQKDELLVQLNDIEYKNRYLIAQKSLDVIKTQLHTANQASFYDVNQKKKIAQLKAEVQLKESELQFAKEQLDKTKIYSKKDGIVIVHNPNEWKGKPVVTGQRILEVANKNSVELKISLPISDAIFLKNEALVKAFLDNDPLNSWKGKIEHISYKPELSEQNILSYKIIASFDNLEEYEFKPTIGLRGTAKIYSEEVSLFFYLFKKPITSLRQFVGW